MELKVKESLAIVIHKTKSHVLKQNNFRMQTLQRKITPENLYSLIQKGSIDKAQELDRIINSEIEPYDLNKDYYKKLREATYRCLKTNSIRKLPEEVCAIKTKDEAQFSSFATLALLISDLFRGKQLEKPSKVSCKKVLHGEVIISTPCHLSIEVNKERWLLWFYYGKAQLPYDRIQVQLHLMHYLSPIKGIPTIVDVQRGAIYQINELTDIIGFIVKQDIDFIINYLRSQSNIAA